MTWEICYSCEATKKTRHIISLVPWECTARYIHVGVPTMAEVSLKVPSMGDSITTGTVASVLKNEGKHVSDCMSLI